MNSLVRGLPTESIKTILTLEMPCKPHSQNKNVVTSYMTSSIRHQFFEFSQGHRPDFPLSNFKKKSILVFSLLSSFRSGLCTKYSKILTRPTVRMSSREHAPRARLTGLTNTAGFAANYQLTGDARRGGVQVREG